jgi:hypothetical protein
VSTWQRGHLQNYSGSGKRLTVHVFAFCALLAVGPAAAQQGDASATFKQLTAPSTVVSQDTRCTGAESCEQSHQSRAPLPNAPSSTLDVNSLTLGERFRIYSRALTRPYTVVGPAFGAGIGQWENEPPEWGQGGEGYGRRFASGMARSVISETIRFGFAAVDGEDPRYHRSLQTGFWNRTRHVFVETFTSESESGTRIPAYSRFAGTYGAAFISNAWYPDSRATAGYALRRGSTALASSLGFHMFEEFAPRKYFKALHIGD